MQHDDIDAVLDIFAVEFDDAANDTVNRAGNVPVTGLEFLLPDRILDPGLFNVGNFYLVLDDRNLVTRNAKLHQFLLGNGNPTRQQRRLAFQGKDFILFGDKRRIRREFSFHQKSHPRKVLVG